MRHNQPNRSPKLVLLIFGALFQTTLTTGASTASTSSGQAGTMGETHPFRVVKDVAYQDADPTEKADLYLPERTGLSSPAPVVIWMHGNHHDKGDAREKNVCSTLAAAGYVSLSINYGTWPDSDVGEETSPRILQNIANARNAVRFIRSHAADYGVDPNRVALFGGSAGGWLSLMVGLTNGDGAFDASPPYAGVSSAVGAIGDFYADVDAWLKSRITAKSPPVLIIQGKSDPAVDYHDSIGLNGLLAAQGVHTELLLLDNVGHGFDLTTWQKKPLPQDLRPVVLKFLAEQLGPVAAAVTSDSPDDPLAHLRASHPRLLLTNDELATVLQAAKTDPLRAELSQHVVATAEAILNLPPVRKPDNGASQEQDRYAVYYILNCAMAYRLTGEERFFARAKSDLLTVAAFADWNPQHFLSIGEMSFAAAIGYDWLYPKLTPAERTLIKRAIMEKSLALAETTYGYRTDIKAMWSWKNIGNWNQVCNSGLLSAALAIADEEPDLARRVIAGARKSMPLGMAAYAPDGGFPEGPGYWTYATTYAAIAFAEMETALGTDFGLRRSPGFDHAADYYEAVEGPFGRMFNYADATDDLQNSPARAYLAKQFGSPFALQHTRSLLADFLRREPIAKFDRGIQGTVVNRFFALHEVWFPDEPTERVTNPPLDFHFRGVADIATFRSAWNDPNAIFVAFKAGENADHHNHLDLGSFVLDADGQRWAVDLGPDNNGGSYTLPGYSDTKLRRWTYFRANNHSHNTVTPGDALQDRHIVAPIVAFGSEPHLAFAVADLTPAYPNEATSLRRGIALLDRARVLVQDEYKPAHAGTPLHWGMVTRAKINVAADGHSALLTSEGRSLRVEILRPTTAQLHVASTRPPSAVENQNEGTAMLAIDVTPESGSDSTSLAVLLTPIGDDRPRLDIPVVKPLVDWR